MNTDYKCPYCNRTNFTSVYKNFRPYDSWKNVRNHVVTCKLNNKSFAICEYYGPISFEIINSYKTIKEFKSDYPNVSFNSSYWYLLRKRNKINLTIQYQSKQALLNCVLEFYKENNKIPIQEDFRAKNKYPSLQSIIDNFGSWNNYLTEAGLSLNNKFGTPTIAKDGITYRSQLEGCFVDSIILNDIKYNYEVKYPEPHTNWSYDFYLPELDLYIELTAGLHPERITKKEIFNKELNRKLLILTPVEVYNKNYMTNLIEGWKQNVRLTRLST